MNDFCFFKYYGDDESGLELFCFKSSLEKKKIKDTMGWREDVELSIYLRNVRSLICTVQKRYVWDCISLK